MRKKRIGVLALQGAFAEHEKVLRSLGAETFELRGSAQLRHEMGDGFDGLILPGGESTVQKRLLHETGMFEPIRALIQGGMPVLGTCAGMILLADELTGNEEHCFGTFPIRVRRNAYGRQLGSFIAEEKVEGVGRLRMNFIRAPYIEAVLDPAVRILAEVNGHIVAAEYKNQLALAFHPEVTSDKRLHEYFLRRFFVYK